MVTVRIRVESKPNGGGYSVRLLSDGEPAPAAPGLSVDMPADLGRATAPGELGEGDVDKAVVNFVRDHADSTEFESIGKFLASLLLPPEISARWRSLRDAHPVGFRTLLEIEPANLRLIPWELMALDERRLFIDPTCVFARADNLQPGTTQEELLPLRLLVVEGTRDEEIKTLAEIRGIKSALPDFHGRVDAEFLCEPTKQELKDAFTRVRPHIFHFVGHGMNDPATGQASLQMPGWLLRREDFINLIRPMPRVVVLNACRSGVGVDDEGSPEQRMRALTEACLSQGAAAVVGMQGDVRGEAAARFASALYRALAREEEIDQAVASARESVWGFDGTSSQQRDWCLPSLTLAVLPEQVLPLRCGITDADWKKVEQRVFGEIRLFVDRTELRWKLASAIDSDEARPQVLRVVGDMDIGKTWLIQWIRTRCALRGRRVRYVNFRGKNLDFVGALRAIRETNEDVPVLAPAAADEAFDGFMYDLAFLANGLQPREPRLKPLEVPQIPEELRLGGDTDEDIFDSFRAALDAATTEQQPLVLILDHLDGVQKAHFQNWMYPNLVRKLIDGDVPNLQLIVVMSVEQRGSYWNAEELRLSEEVLVNLIPPDDYVACAEEVLFAMRVDVAGDSETLINTLRRVNGESPWKPSKLKPLQAWFEG